MTGQIEAQVGTDLLQKWRARNSHRSALLRWHEAPTEQRGQMAFALLAQDPWVLERLQGGVGARIAEAADAYARCIPPSASPVSLEAARFVVNAVQSWRAAGSNGSNFSFNDSDQVESVYRPKNPSEADWTWVRRQAPCHDELSGRTCFDAVALHGAAWLGKLGSIWAVTIGLGALRYAARLVRCEVMAPSPPDHEALTLVLQSVFDWVDSSGTDPFAVRLPEGQDPSGKVEASLARDAATCRTALRRYLDSSAERPSEVVLSAAMTRFGVAALSLDPGLLRRDDVEDGTKFAVAEGAMAAVTPAGESTRDSECHRSAASVTEVAAAFLAEAAERHRKLRVSAQNALSVRNELRDL